MFTGIVETKGTLVRRTARGPDARLAIRGELGGEPIELGESIAIDGVCLTVDAVAERPKPGGAWVLEFDASSETLTKTTLGELAPAAPVNLERALRIGGRLGGHIVSGHVDGVGRIAEVSALGAARKVVFEAPSDLLRFIAPKGSICVSGVSLTVNGVSGNRFDVVLIPHTQEKTSLDALGVGARVNLEVDLLARYVARLRDSEASASRSGDPNDSRMLDRLKTAGYL